MEAHIAEWPIPPFPTPPNWTKIISLFSTPLFLYKLSVKRSGGNRFGMSVSQGLRANLQGAFGERYCLAQVALLLIEDGQIMQAFEISQDGADQSAVPEE